MQIRLASIMVNNQESALRFYTTILGFVKNKDIPMGPFRCGFAPAQTYQAALFAAGTPATAFITNDIASEHRRLKERGVSFRGEPRSTGPITAVLFENAWRNLTNLVQPTAGG